MKRVETKWESLVLVCRKCGKRNGMESKTVRRELKNRLSDLKPGLRVVESGCLGVCPKGIAVARLSVETGARAFVVTSSSDDQLDKLEAGLRAD